MIQTKVPITVLILTKNEELNIKQALVNVTNWAQDVFILDSGSTDNTIKIATSLEAQIFFRPFDNYALQRTYAMKELPIKTDWCFFLDADEYLSEELKSEINNLFSTGSINEYDGYFIKRRFVFLNKWIKHGGYYPSIHLRLFKKDKASIDRIINEHITVNGKVGKLKNDFVDHNHKDLHEWVNKHNIYSDMEAAELIHVEHSQMHKVHRPVQSFFTNKPFRMRIIRKYIWNILIPTLIKPHAYFIYRYFLRFGFLDGKPGYIYFMLQSFVMVSLTNFKYLEKTKFKSNSRRSFD